MNVLPKALFPGLEPLSPNPTKWSKTLKPFFEVGAEKVNEQDMMPNLRTQITTSN